MRNTPEQLAAVLDDIRERVLSGDSVAGHVEWGPAKRAGIYEVTGAYRIGNQDGQGGVRLLSASDEEDDMGERQDGETGRGAGESRAADILKVTREQVGQIMQGERVGATEAMRRAKRQNLKALLAMDPTFQDVLAILRWIAEEMPL